MWLLLIAINALLLIEKMKGQDCPFTVSVLDVPGVRCVPSMPCSGTYYASGLSQGVGACPTGSGCALLPLTPIMGCAVVGRTDLVYVNADGSLTKDGQPVTLLGAPVSTVPSTEAGPNSSNIDAATDVTESSSTTRSSLSDDQANVGLTDITTSLRGSNDGANTNNLILDSNRATNLTSSNSLTNSLDIESRNATDSHGSNDANQQGHFDPGSILSDDSANSSQSSKRGLGLGSIIAAVVGCLAIVAIVAGARLLKKGKDADLATPEAAGGHEAYNNVDGGGGMTPKENVLLL